jgi:DNA-binding NtrC family response regulator
VHAQILICGTDPTLLSTRRDILRSVGFDVSTASRPEEIEGLIQAPTVDALVICHTLKPEQQEEALAILHRYRPTAKSIILTKSTSRAVDAHPDAFVCTTEGPKTLIQALGRLLNHT